MGVILQAYRRNQRSFQQIRHRLRRFAPAFAPTIKKSPKQPTSTLSPPSCSPCRRKNAPATWQSCSAKAKPAECQTLASVASDAWRNLARAKRKLADRLGEPGKRSWRDRQRVLRGLDLCRTTLRTRGRTIFASAERTRHTLYDSNRNTLTYYSNAAGACLPWKTRRSRRYGGHGSRSSR
jgi:hypothetical protein